MPLTLHLSRLGAGSVREYLFLPVEQIAISFSNKAISPALPGNDSTSIPGGANAPNFQFDLGIQQMQIKVAGTLVSINGTSDLPPIPSNTRYIGRDRAAPSGGGTRPSYSGGDLRTALLDFTADQNVNSNVFLGYPNWNSGLATDPSPNPADFTLAGVNYRKFNGLVMEVQVDEASGLNDAFEYNFSFVVGSN